MKGVKTRFGTVEGSEGFEVEETATRKELKYADSATRQVGKPEKA
jgi:hypothetical protein